MAKKTEETVEEEPEEQPLQSIEELSYVEQVHYRWMWAKSRELDANRDLMQARVDEAEREFYEARDRYRDLETEFKRTRYYDPFYGALSELLPRGPHTAPPTEG